MNLNELTEAIIGAAIEVHRHTGPGRHTGQGLLESTNEQCLCRELSLRGIPFEYQKPLPVRYKGELIDCGYRVDILVAEHVVIELKSIEKLLPIHEAQLLTYLRLGGRHVGFLIDFNVEILRLGIKRLVNNLSEPSSASSAPLR